MPMSASQGPGIPAEWAELVDVASDGCWEWTGGRQARGYGIWKQRGAHRASYELFHGPIPAGQVVCHRCDNPPCVNPEHLWAGTQGDNMRDMLQKARDNHPRGEAHVWAKLTEERVREARQLRAAGVGLRELARRWGVSHTALGQAVRGQTWGWVE